jgi:hypothetical protein
MGQMRGHAISRRASIDRPGRQIGFCGLREGRAAAWMKMNLLTARAYISCNRCSFLSEHLYARRQLEHNFAATSSESAVRGIVATVAHRRCRPHSTGRGPRERAEDESVTRLASEFVAAVLPRVKKTPGPERALAALIGSLQNSSAAGSGRLPKAGKYLGFVGSANSEFWL